MISVVVPCYNCKETLERCCESIFLQKSERYEVILVNDGSTDSTGNLCDELAGSHENTKVVHQKNMGLMNAWKNGVRIAKGEYILFVDSDDWVEPDLIEHIEQIINNEDEPDIIFYGIETDFSNGTVTKKSYSLEEKKYTKEEIKNEILPNYFCAGRMESQRILSSRWSKVIKRELLVRNLELLNGEISVGEDTLTSFAVMQDAVSVYNILNYYPYHYCRHENSMMGNYDVHTVEKFVKVREELYKIAEEKGYPFKQQIENYFLDNILITLKKIAFSKKYNLKERKGIFRKICQMPEIKKVLVESRQIARNYKIQHKMFIALAKIASC